MKTLLFAPILLFALASADCHHPVFAATAANVGGKWQLSLATPHGPVSGALDLHQDGDKLSGSCSSDHFDAVPITGSIDGTKVVISLNVHGMAFELAGVLEGDRLSGTTEPDFGTWTGTRQSAAAAHISNWN